MANAKRTTTVDLGGGVTAKRTSASMHYTHAVVAEYTEKNKAEDVAAAEQRLRYAVLEEAEMAALRADPVAVAEYAALRAAAVATQAAAVAARKEFQAAEDAEVARQRALGYGVPGAPNVMIGGTSEWDTRSRNVRRIEHEAWEAARARSAHNLSASDGTARALAGAREHLAHAQARAAGASTRHAFSWHTSAEAARKGVLAARRAGFTGYVARVSG